MAVINVTPLMDITDLIASDNVNEGDVLLLEEGIYYQTVNILNDNIRIVAKGPGVIFDGRSILISSFLLSDVSGVSIEGINIRHYRASGILIQSGFGNRIINNRIKNMLDVGIEIVGSGGNLIWKNEVCNSFEGIRLTLGSTSNWIIENIVRECTDHAFETVFSSESNNAFISNTAIGNRGDGFSILGSNNLVLNNFSDNDQGILIMSGNSSLVIGNKITGSKLGAISIISIYENFFAGGTASAKGTVQMSVRDGIDYLYQIARSLLKQGFRRQIYVTCHAPAYLTVGPVIRDFFEETKCPILYIDMVKAADCKDLSFSFIEAFNDICIGAYKILGRLDDVPLNVPESHSVTYDIQSMLKGMEKNPANKLGKHALPSCAVGSYFDKPSDHMVTPLLKTAEEREQHADIGVKAIEEFIKLLDMPNIVKTLREVDEYTEKDSLAQYEWLR